MAQYVCDVEQVIAIGEQVCQAVTALEASVTAYSSNIDGDLSGWTGTAKSSFKSTNDEQVKQTTTDLSQINELGEFIKSSAQSIQALEEQLATLTI